MNVNSFCNCRQKNMKSFTFVTFCLRFRRFQGAKVWATICLHGLSTTTSYRHHILQTGHSVSGCYSHSWTVCHGRNWRCLLSLNLQSTGCELKVALAFPPYSYAHGYRLLPDGHHSIPPLPLLRQDDQRTARTTHMFECPFAHFWPWPSLLRPAYSTYGPSLGHPAIQDYWAHAPQTRSFIIYNHSFLRLRPW